MLTERLPPAQSVQVHRRLGECLEAVRAADPTELAPTIALHFEQGKDYGRALHYQMPSSLRFGTLTRRSGPSGS